MDATSKQPKLRRKWEPPTVTVLAFRDTRNVFDTKGDSLGTGLLS